jgi:hypothetical protein
MAAPPAVITQGQHALMLMSEEIETSLDDFDVGTMEYFMPQQDSLVAGIPSPDYPGMIIKKVNARMEVDAWIGRCSVQGLKSGTSRRIDRVFTRNIEGMDDGNESWIVKGVVPSRFTIGGIPSGYADAAGYSNMRVISAPTQELWGGFKRVSLRYLGSLGAKSYKRRITCDGQVVQPTEVITVSFSGGWTAKKGRIEMPEIVIEDTYVVTAQPNFAVIPGNETPPDPPAVAVFTITGDLTHQWPNGWTIQNITYDPIPGTAIGTSTRRYRYKWAATF